ncbi:unnamed protein product, partial [Symbiodinium pilosum]
MAAGMSAPYAQALLDRMVAFPEGSVSTDTLPNRSRKLKLPSPPCRYKVVSMSLGGQGLSGVSLAGEELFLLPEEQLAADMLLGQVLEEIAGLLHIDAAGLTCVRDEKTIGVETTWQDVKEALPETMLKMDLNHHDVFPLVCRKSDARFLELPLGEGHVRNEDARFRDLQATVQVIEDYRRFVTRAQDNGNHHLLHYGRAGVLANRITPALRGDLFIPIGYFPMAPVWQMPPDAKRWGQKLDVWSCTTSLPEIKSLLDAHAEKTNDRPIPRYQMIVDPNQFVRETEEGPVWVPCEFDVDADGAAHLVGGSRSHRNPGLAARVAQPVLEAALPLLAKLRRPQLLLDNRRIQVVFKAQRIIVPATVSKGSDSEYVGLWHVDGCREHIAAVVLYYYHVDENLEGGAMEFCGREPLDVLGWGDCSNNYYKLTKEGLRAALRTDETKSVENCRVPISTGRLLVFSNYQVAHRVLRMVNRGAAEASRDFVALFLVDPAKPLVPARSVLSESALLARTLATALYGTPQPSGKAFEVLRILQFLGVLRTTSDARRLRNSLLREQLQPSGEFCGNSSV